MRPRLILASGSPRRRALLAAAGYRFEVIVPGIDEAVLPDEAPAVAAERLAREKAASIDRVGAGDVVLALDTIVACDGVTMGKPSDADTARAMLTALSGRTHAVSTGWAVRTAAALESGVDTTLVRMRRLGAAEIDAYVASGAPYDKAGGYALQDRSAGFVAEVVGARSTVVGLPLPAVAPVLARHGIERAESVPGQ